MLQRRSSAIVPVDGDCDGRSVTQQQLEPAVLEPKLFDSPLATKKQDLVRQGLIVGGPRYIMYDPHVDTSSGASDDWPRSRYNLKLRLACVHHKLHFDPAKTVIGIVTCGGLCPGLNDVIRGITLSALQLYGVRRVIGFPYGYWGLSKEGRDHAFELTINSVASIHRIGGSSLGTSRGPQPINEMVETLIQKEVNVLFAIGGDGTQKGLNAISAEVRRRGLDIAVIGVPKTIDNDLSFSQRTFGYETAVEQAVSVIRAARAEAVSHEYGIGIVKLMGRHSGFIAAQATVASSQVNICLIPENPLSLDTVCKLVHSCFLSRKHCVIVVAEGFGQDWPQCKGESGPDRSGNAHLGDIGLVLKKALSDFIAHHDVYRVGCVKYIDPSYFIRSCPANSSDSAFCCSLATFAVHEAMAGTTDALITMWYSNLAVVPIKLAVSLRRVVSLYGQLWLLLRQVTVDVDINNSTKTLVPRDANAEISDRMEGGRDKLSKL